MADRKKRARTDASTPGVLHYDDRIESVRPDWDGRLGMSQRRPFHWFVVFAVVATISASAAEAAPQPAGSPIDGRWSSSFPLARLRASGAPKSCVQKAYWPWTAEFRNGHYRIQNQRSGASGSGTFSTSGTTVRFVRVHSRMRREPIGLRCQRLPRSAHVHEPNRTLVRRLDRRLDEGALLGTNKQDPPCDDIHGGRSAHVVRRDELVSDRSMGVV